LTGTENAILDYRYTPSDRVTWYFDHHRTAFANDDDRAFFEQRRALGKYFFDPAYTSCTKLIADVSREHFGVEVSAFGELLSWAEKIDSAAFESAEEACDTTSPVMRLVSVVEHHGNNGFISQTVPRLLDEPLLQVAATKDIERRYTPIGQRYEAFAKAVKENAQNDGRIVVVNLTERLSDVLGKFVTYSLYPDAMYSIVAARLARGFKIAVGFNPWCNKPLDRDISAICARYGGGGHQAVGGVSLPENQKDRVLTVVEEIRLALTETETGNDA
jgi:hypothetical protein